MKKADAETIIRILAQEWATETGFDLSGREAPNFQRFFEFVRNRRSDALEFRTTTGVNNDVEMWFDDELRQNWRN